MTEAIPAGSRTPSWMVDAAASLVVTVFVVVVTAHLSRGALDWPGYLLLVLAGGALALCRRHPVLALAVVTAVLATYVGRHYRNGPILATGWIALIAVGWRTRRAIAVLGAALLCGAFAAVVLVTGGDTPLPLFFVGWSTAAVLAGDALRSRRLRLDSLRERTEALERSREEEALRRIAEDRLRIARDLHDSVAHGMATIAVQAGAAVYVLDRQTDRWPGPDGLTAQRPDGAGRQSSGGAGAPNSGGARGADSVVLIARDALVTIQRASAEVLDELAGMLTVLRGGDATDRAGAAGAATAGERCGGQQPGDPGPAGRGPAPGVADLKPMVASLAASMGAAALRVRLSVEGPLDEVPEPVGVAAYRIVQESLTNVVKHSGASAASVRVRVGDGRAVEVEVHDDGRGATGRGAGFGIRGMRERAESTGGALAAGPLPEGGYAVRAVWPARP